MNNEVRRIEKIEFLLNIFHCIYVLFPAVTNNEMLQT